MANFLADDLSLLFILFLVVLISGGIAIIKRSAFSKKVFTASIILAIEFYVYSYMHLILKSIPRQSIFFFVIGWLPFLLGVGMYILIVHFIISPNSKK